MKYLKFVLITLVLALVGTLASAQSTYRVQPGDVLVIEVLEDSNLNRSVVVLPDGTFTFPFAGTVRASGRNVSQITSAIVAGIQSNYSNPPTVFVSAQPSAQQFAPSGSSASGNTIDVYFLGEANNPGLLRVERGTTMLQAIAIGGGVTRFAAVKRIQLRRTNPQTGMQSVIKLNYKALADGTASQAIELRDGDVILVPERRLFE